MTPPEFTNYLNSINNSFHNYDHFKYYMNELRKDSNNASYIIMNHNYNNDDIKILTGDYFMWNVKVYK